MRELLQHWEELMFVLFLAILLFSSGNKLGPAIRDLFRGGPRPPIHPLPADDSRILNRPRQAGIELGSQK